MCVVESKTYVYADQRRETIRKEYRCHNAPARRLCKNVEVLNTEAARVVERRPDSERPSSMSNTITTEDGREYRYFPLSRRSSKRSSTGRPSDSGRQSPIDSLVSSSPPRGPTYKTIRPPAPSPPPTRSIRRVSFHEPYTTSRHEAVDGTAVYSRPPPLSMLRASVNGRPSLDRRSSISSLTNEVDESEIPRRRSSIKRDRRPSSLDLGNNSRDAAISSQASSPGLSDLPRIRRDQYEDLAARNTTRATDQYQSRTSREEDARQACLVRDAINATDQRQNARESRLPARKHSEDLSQDPSLQRKSSQRRNAAADLAGESSASASQRGIDRETERRFQAEMAQIAREKQQAVERRLREEYQQPPRTLPSASTYQYTPTSPTNTPRPRISARTPSDIPSAGPPRYGRPIVHQPTPPRDPLAEQGERVIKREQARANEEARRLAERLAGAQLYDEAYDDGREN